MFWDNEVIKYIDEKLLQTWSPEQTLAERTTRYYIAIKMLNRNSVTMTKTIVEALSELPKDGELNADTLPTLFRMLIRLKIPKYNLIR